jgi:WD40 repeat protein
MVHEASPFPRFSGGLLVGVFLLLQGEPSPSAEPPGKLQLDKALQCDEKTVTTPIFAPDGKTVAGCGLDWLDDISHPAPLRLWSVDSGKKILDLSIPDATIISIAYAKDGQRLFSGSFDAVVRIHDLRSLKTEVIPNAAGQLVAMSPGGDQLAVSAGQTVQMVDVASKKITAEGHLEEALDNILAPCPMAFSPNGKVIAVARRDRLRAKEYEVQLWNSRDLNPVGILRDTSRSVVAVLDYSPDGSLLATGGSDGILVVWDVNAMIQRKKVNVSADANSKGVVNVKFSPDGKLLGIGVGGAALLLRADTLEVVDTIKGSGEFTTVAFSADGRLLLTSCSDATPRRCEIKLWRFRR